MGPGMYEQGTLKERLRKPVEYIFGDDIMMTLAVLLIPSTVLPFFVSFSPIMLLIFEYLNYGIIIFFMAEYALKLYVADSRKAYVTDLWHVLDLIIIVLAVADFMPFALPDWGRYAPIFRLVRIPRAFAVAGRTVKRAKQSRGVAMDGGNKGPMKICAVDHSGAVKCIEGNSIASLEGDKTNEWIDLQNVSKMDIETISKAFRVPTTEIESKAIKETYPRIDHFKDYTTIFLHDYKLHRGEAGKGIRLDKSGMLVVCTGDLIVTASTSYNSVFDEVSRQGLALPNEDIPVRALYSIFKKVVDDYDDITHAMESRLAELEELPVGRSGQEFLEETFRLKKEINILYHSLRHFMRVIDTIVEKKVALKGMDDRSISHFKVLLDEVDYMYNTSSNIRDGLISLIELHINTVSLDMNRFMRVLATLTCLGLVPTIIGGLLGENLFDTPYQITIWEIFLVVLSIMGLGMYVFWKKGWLR